MHELWSQVSWVQITALLLTNKVTRGRSMPPCASSCVNHHHYYYYCEGERKREIFIFLVLT